MTTLLVVTAHPDDESLIAGGLLAAAARRGLTTAVLCLTRGEAGEVADQAALDGRQLHEVRVLELRAACDELGVSWLRCWKRPDGSLAWDQRSRVVGQLVSVLERLRPEAVVTFGDDGLYYHPDHIATGRMTVAAVNRLAGARPRLFRAVWPVETTVRLATQMQARQLPTGLWGLDPEDFGTEAGPDEASLDVSPFVAVKLRALRCHRSQLSPGHLFQALPADLALAHLGQERFRGRSADDNRWLQEALAA
jgi:LmbE family N-acetylglucosaminyl deacetylase